jgi:predicted SAM-dependent methyltransferase
VLCECFRCLKVGGVLRIAAPDLGYVIHKYDTDWSDQDWLSWPGYEAINTKGKMINASFRWWGHKYLYDEDDLREQLARTGFTHIIRCSINESDYEDLRNLETRQDSTLIIEASKEDSSHKPITALPRTREPREDVVNQRQLATENTALLVRSYRVLTR